MDAYREDRVICDSKKNIIVSLDDQNKSKSFEMNNLDFTSVDSC